MHPVDMPADVNALRNHFSLRRCNRLESGGDELPAGLIVLAVERYLPIR